MTLFSFRKHSPALGLFSPLARFLLTTSLFLAATPLQALDFTIYIDSDFNTVTGCMSDNTGTTLIEGAESRIDFTVTLTAPHYVDSLTTASCASGSFQPAVDQPAGFPIGSNNGIDSSDVIEIETVLSAIGLEGNEIINAAIVGNESGTPGPVIFLPGLDLNSGGVTLGPAVAIPVLAPAGMVLLTALFLFIGLRHLPGRAGLAALLVVLSGALLAQTVRFVADGLIDDWAGLSPATSNSPGSGSPLTDIRQVFVATQDASLFVRLDVTEIESYTVGGRVTGLISGGDVVLKLNGSNEQTLSADGEFVFPPLLGGSNYIVSVSDQPDSQTCSVANGSGTLSHANVTNVSVVCSDNDYTLGGHVSGLLATKSVVLQNNGGDDLAVTANGAFTFLTPLNFGDAYNVTVLTNPTAPNETCTVSSGSGNMPINDVNSVSVTCAVNTYTVGGALSGLFSGESVVLQINGTLDQTLTADGNYVFPALADGTDYVVTVATQPTGQTCTVNNDSGQLTGANVSNVDITCVNETYNVGGLLSGLAGGDTVVLQNNNGDDLNLNADGSFSFSTPVTYGSPYSVTVKTQPPAPSETCTVSNGAGTMPANDVNNVSVTCTVNTYTVGGTLTGLFSGGSVMLQLNGSFDQVLSADGNFVFPALADASNYDVTVATQPFGQTCTVSNGSGTLAGANIATVNVNCVNHTFDLGGTLSGLVTGFGNGNTVVLQNNGNDLALSANGSFTFSAPVAYGHPYSVTVKTQPNVPNESCTVSNGNGVMPASNFNGVSVDCPVETPKLSAVDPAFGPTAGGYTVELSGSGFLPTGTTVKVDGTEDCTAVTVIDSKRLTCTMPSSISEGLSGIEVTTSAGQSDPVEFRYENPKLTTLITGTEQTISFHTVQLTGAVATVTTGTPTYQWTQIFGDPVNNLAGENTPNLSFEAPAVSIGQSVEFKLDTTADGATGHATHVVTISPETVGVDAGPDVQAVAETDISFHAGGHTSGGGALTWSWNQIAGTPVAINGGDTPNATFTAPATVETLKFEVTVKDPANVEASDIVEVTLSAPTPPVVYPASAVAAQSGDLVQLQAMVAPSLPVSATVAWSQVKGPSVTLQNANGLTPSFTAPAVTQPTELEFRVQVTTTYGNGSVTYMKAQIYPSSPIQVDAGKDQRAESGDTIQLHADVLTGVNAPVFEWKQIPVPGGLPAGLTGSRQATLVNADAQTVTLQLPTIPDTPDNLSNRMAFQVTVSQGLWLGTDIVLVDLRRLLVNAQVADQALLGRSNAFPGEIVHLTSSISNSKAPLTVTWSQTSGPTATLTGTDKPDASATLPQLGDYVFEVDVTDALGNKANDTITISAIDRSAPPKLVLPPASALTAAVTGGSTKTSNQTFEADQGIMAEVFYNGEITPPTITWTQTSGPATPFTPSVDGKTITFDAPLVTADTQLSFEVTVDDTDKVVTVPVNYLIQDRFIGLSIDPVADTYTGKTSTLHGNASGGGGALNYLWTQVSNGAPMVPLQDFTTSTAHFTSAQPGTYVFELAVSDNLNNSATAQVTAQVDPVPAPPGPATAPIEILFPPAVVLLEGNTFKYTAKISNLPAGAEVTWTEVLGNVNPAPIPDPGDPGTVDLTLPAVTADTLMQLKATVTDGVAGPVLKEASSPGLIVRDRSISVSAQVTGSGKIKVNDTVHLSATADPGAFGAVNYQWVLSKGSGNLSNANTATPTFVPDQEETAELEVTATDALGNTASAIVSVVVEPAPAPKTPLSLTVPDDQSEQWPADATEAANKPVALQVTPTGGSGNYRYDYNLQVFEYSNQAGVQDTWKDNDSLDARFRLDLDISTIQNPKVALTSEYFSGANLQTCKGTPCALVDARLVITVTDTGTGETKTGTTQIKWKDVPPITGAQTALVSNPPAPGAGCLSGQALKDQHAAWEAAVANNVPVGEYVCAGPPALCEILQRPGTPPPVAQKKFYGILVLTNMPTGARTMEKRFGNMVDAQEWFQGSSDNDRCTTEDLNFVLTLDFQCTYAYEGAFANGAGKNGCNLPGNSKHNNLFKN